MINTNYLIVGSGVAGLTFAIEIANSFPERKVIIITKASDDESNTKYAQGGIAIVTDTIGDSYENHIADTLLCGDGLCNEAVVRMVITEGPKRLKELISWGANFDKNDAGSFDLGKEGGHSEKRIIHHKDQTGQEIARAILEKAMATKNITLLNNHFALELIVENNVCKGVYALNQISKEIVTYSSDYTLLATGGIGHLYGHTTNPIIATGDGVAMAARANAEIQDMEFIQFHPTSFYNTKSNTKFLISEAVRGFGAYLRTKDGVRFMINYDSRQELASRDIISQSIEMELKKSGDDCVYLDCTHLDVSKFKAHFPMIYEHCMKAGIDISKDWIPVAPAQHYLCGGIAVNMNGKTSIDNLFACGECTGTGLHGANRLASNSLLEALVYANCAYKYLKEIPLPSARNESNIVEWETSPKQSIDKTYIANTKTELQHLMRKSAGIVRKDDELLRAKKQLLLMEEDIKQKIDTYKTETALYELYNMIIIGKLIVQASIERNDNRGGFYKVIKYLPLFVLEFML